MAAALALFGAASASAASDDLPPAAERPVDFVRDVQRIVPAGTPIYQVDGSGYLGFFS